MCKLQTQFSEISATNDFIGVQIPLIQDSQTIFAHETSEIVNFSTSENIHLNSSLINFYQVV